MLVHVSRWEHENALWLRQLDQDLGNLYYMTFIDNVLRFTRESESPRKYYYWSALSAIAAIVKSNVWLDKHFYKLYPNIYVLLVGRSGIRKGPPINLARSLTQTVNNTRVFAGRVSIQGVISELSKAITKKEGGPPLTDAAGLLVASEFASFIIQDQAALTILTDLYDGHYNPEWTYMLRNSPAEKLKNPCLNLLGATNEEHLKDVLPDNAIGGGFLARTFIIYADKKSGINPLTDKPKDTIPIEVLVENLRAISQVKGEFKWSSGGKNLYNEWYTKFQELDQAQEDTTGTMERLHDHILKTAMLISLSRKQDLVLELADIDEAIMACQDFLPGSKRVALGQAGISISSVGTATVIKELIMRKDHTMLRSEMAAKHWATFDSFELDRIADSMVVQKSITIKPLRTGNGIDSLYILNPKVLENYLNKETKKIEKKLKDPNEGS